MQIFAQLFLRLLYLLKSSLHFKIPLLGEFVSSFKMKNKNGFASLILYIKPWIDEWFMCVCKCVCKYFLKVPLHSKILLRKFLGIHTYIFLTTHACNVQKPLWKFQCQKTCNVNSLKRRMGVENLIFLQHLQQNIYTPWSLIL